MEIEHLIPILGNQVTIRRQDGNPSSIASPLLHFDKSERFPSIVTLSVLMSKLCGTKDHNEHTHKDIASCYMSFLRKCGPDSYGPVNPYTRERVLSPWLLPGQRAVIDHIRFQLEMCRTGGGGTFKHFIKDTVDTVISNRQICSKTKFSVNTIIFGISSVAEVKDFICSFNTEIDSMSKSEYGKLPSSFYHFGVGYCKLPPDVSAEMSYLDGKNRVTKEISHKGESLPARISLGTWNKRWDIVFNFKNKELNDSYKGFFVLHQEKLQLDNMWFTLFSKLHGYATSPDAEKMFCDVNRLISTCFTFRNGSGDLSLKIINFNLFLLFAGWNDPTIVTESVNFVFTGGVIARPFALKMGLGKFSEVVLPREVDLFLQSECVATMNAVSVSSMCWLLHWFVNPGISSLLTKKDPVKFLQWFLQFQTTIMKGKLPTSAFEKDRSAWPTSAAVNKIIFRESEQPVWHHGPITEMFPSWGNVTTEGCLSDLTAMNHLFYTFFPVLSSKIMQKHLTFDCRAPFICTALSGSPCPDPSGRQSSFNAGCYYDKDILKIPNIMKEVVENKVKVTLNVALLNYRDSYIEPESPLKSMSARHLSLLFTWRHPTTVLKLMMDDAEFKYLDPEDYLTLKPVAVALLGAPIQDADQFSKVREEEHRSRDLEKLKRAEVQARSDDPIVAKKAEKFIKLIKKKLAKYPEPPLREESIAKLLEPSSSDFETTMNEDQIRAVLTTDDEYAVEVDVNENEMNDLYA